MAESATGLCRPPGGGRLYPIVGSVSLRSVDPGDWPSPQVLDYHLGCLIRDEAAGSRERPGHRFYAAIPGQRSYLVPDSAAQGPRDKICCLVTAHEQQVQTRLMAQRVGQLGQKTFTVVPARARIAQQNLDLIDSGENDPLPTLGLVMDEFPHGLAHEPGSTVPRRP